MPYFRLVAAAIGLAVPVAFTTASAARPPARHPPAYVRTATYRVAHHAAWPGGHAAPHAPTRLIHAAHRQNTLRGS